MAHSVKGPYGFRVSVEHRDAGFLSREELLLGGLVLPPFAKRLVVLSLDNVRVRLVRNSLS